MRTNLDPFINGVSNVSLVLPVPLIPPTDLTALTLIDNVTTNTYKIIIIKKSGWYNAQVRAGSGSGGHGGSGKNGGCISDSIIYLYKGSKVLMWGATSGTGTVGYTGYPVPTGTAPSAYSNGRAGLLGGSGATGYDESGGGGGGAGGSGGHKHSDAGNGGGGAGIIAGINTVETLSEEFSIGKLFSVKSVIAMILAGGGGGGVGTDGDRATGGGGGAWGSGGGCYSGAYGGTGPGTGDPLYVAGEYGAHYNGGGQGAWCLRNFSTGAISSGVGIKSGNTGTAGTVALYWIDNQIIAPTQFWDLGLVTDGDTNTYDGGAITDSVTITKDMGSLVA